MKNLALVSFVVSLILATSSSAWIAVQVYRFEAYQMDLDEATHAMRGMEFASIFHNNDLSNISKIFTQPHWYPPINGVLMGIWFSILGGGVPVARLYSTLCFLLFAILLWVISKRLFPLHHPMVWILPVIFLTADELYIVHASMVMLELPAIFLSFTTLFLYNVSRQQSQLRTHVFILAFAVLLVKYSYGIVLIATLLICELYEFIFLIRKVPKPKTNRERLLRFWLAWIPMLTLLVYWFVVLDEWKWLVSYSNAQPANYGFLSWSNLLYYPRLILSEPLGYILVTLSLITVILHWRERSFWQSLLPIIAFLIIAFVMLTIELQDSPRFGMLLMPPLWLFSANGLQDIIRRIKVRSGQTYALVIIVLCGCFFIAATARKLPTKLMVAYENSNTGVNQAYQLIGDTLLPHLPSPANIVILGATDQWNAPAVHFTLETLCMAVDYDCNLYVQDQVDLRHGRPPQRYSAIESRLRYTDAMEKADFLITFSQAPDNPDRWQLLAQERFLFEARRKDPEMHKISIYSARNP